MDNQTIVVRGAREHNLRNVNLDLPRNQLIVFTGVSGSGKSSLAFDTLYAEGQRRYVESLSSYARQFLGQMQKPDVDYLGGLSPAISIQQKTAGRNPRSTVGTITEILDFLRVLYARIGQGHCPVCGRPITAQTREQIIAGILGLPPGTRYFVLAPMVRGQKGEYKDLFEDMLRRGFLRARVNGQLYRLTDDIKLDKRIKHHIEIVIDRLQISDGKESREDRDKKLRPRLAEAVEQALNLGEGNLIVAIERDDIPSPPTPLPRGERGEVDDSASARESELAAGDPESRIQNPKSKIQNPKSEDLLFSAHYACTHCQKSYEPPTPQLFSFNSPQGMCLECDGLGTRFTFDPELLIPDPSLSFYTGAIPIVGPLRGMGRWRKHIFEGVGKAFGMDLKKPWRSMPKEHQDVLLNGAGDRHITYEWKQRGGVVWKHGGTWEGIIPQLMSSFKKTAAGPRRLQLEKYMRVVPCAACGQQRLNPQARAVRVGGKTLPELCALPIGEVAAWLAEPATGACERPGSPESRGLTAPARQIALAALLTPLQHTIAAELLKEIRGRVQFLLNVGLHYLTLDRSAPTLSGGEAQRIRLAGQIGCGLVGVLYILDEPSIGLHPRDNERLLRSLEQLRNLGNTVVVVEHDEETMRAADYIVDFGPGPGVRGGEVVAAGSYAEIVASPRSLTGRFLSGAEAITIPDRRRPPNGQTLRIEGARHHNLNNITVDIPLGAFVCVTGVSGSGKSSLINDILLEGLRQHFGQRPGNDETEEGEDDADAHWIGAHDRITGTEHLDKVIAIDQSAIGRTPRSNPGTYIKVFDQIRDLYAQMPEAKIRGYKAGRFSFNRPGGRCEACEGNGSNRLEMDFLADVWVTCPVCEGKRFNRETLQIRFKDKNIHEVLDMDVQEALEHFANVPRIREMLQTLHDVGLDYIKIGQASPTLSGGEAQRIKLARELCKRSTGKTLYILDEPTTGLHFEDIRKLLQVLHSFVAAGNTVVVIEHNLDVIKTADWIIDLGPDGGAGGGTIVCAGTPEQVAASPESYTGQALAPVLRRAAAKPARSASESRPRRTNGKKSGGEPPGRLTHIVVQGAQQHNLKNLNVALPRDQMTVCCGPSGSGKSSLALDTIYAEGQRRYVESLSSYARQFLGQVQKPRVESVSGLSPAISIEQKTTSKSPRSTVGTVTEIYDYLRILYARLGQPHCPVCQIPIGTQTADEIIDKIMSLPEGTRLYLMAPVERKGQSSYEGLWDELRRTGFQRIRVDGQSYNVTEPPAIDHRRKHAVEVIIDRIIVRHSQRSRLAESVEAGLDLGKGVLHVALVDEQKREPDWRVERYSQHYACDNCGRSYEPLNPHHFSFNSPLGWCPTCEGLGFQRGANSAVLIRDPNLTLRQGAIAAWPALTDENPFTRFAVALARHAGFSLDTPYKDLEPTQQRAILTGTGEDWIELAELRAASANAKSKIQNPKFQYKGLMPAIDEASRISFVYRHKLDSIVSEVPCATCRGSRLRPDAAASRFDGLTVGELCGLPMGNALTRFKNLKLGAQQQQVAGELLREIGNRLQFLVDVGLDYLTLDRGTPTLSGGESQRIRLASQIGSGLTGVLYVLDEPTIGLHPRDNRRLLQALMHLRDLGNSLVLVEHDREVIAAADHLLDFGPGAGIHGGQITAQGPPAQVQRKKESLTGQYLSGKKAIPVPTNRRLSADKEKRRQGEEETRRQGDREPEDKEKRRQGDKEKRKSRRLVGAPPLLPVSLSPCLLIKGARQNNLKYIDVRLPLGSFIAVTGVSGSGKSSLISEILYNALARKLHRARTVVGAHDDILGLEHIDKVINVDQDPIGNSPSSNPATYTGVFDLIRELFARVPDAKVRGYQAKRFSFNKPGGRCEACEGNGQKKIEMHFLPDVWVECEVCRGARYNPETLAVRYKGKSIADVLQMSVAEALDLFANVPKIRQILQTLADVGLEYISLGQAAPTLSGGEAQRVKLAAELARPNTGRTVYLLDEPTTGLHFDDIRKLLDVLNRLVDLGNTVIVVEHNLDVIKTADWVIDLGPEAGAAGGRIVAEGTPEEVARVAASHTGAILAEVLAAGPHAERRKYDPHKVEAPRQGDQDIDDVGRSAKMPWETDGKRWHTSECISHSGKRCHWEGAILEWIDKVVHEMGDFGPTNWNHRSVIEIAAPVRSHGWFLHAMTGHEWYIRLGFRVAKNTFRQEELNRKLAIPTFNNTEGIQYYSNESRVQVANRAGPWQEVAVLAYKLKEIDTPAFRDFLKQAIAAFNKRVTKASLKPEDVMPWKVNGERWHLSDKGFPIGRKVKWDRQLLPQLLALMRQVEPSLEIRWDTRDSISFYLSGISRSWSQWRTKDDESLETRFVGKKGQFNLSRIEKFGRSPNICDKREEGDILRFYFQRQEHLHGAELRELLKEHLQGFRELARARK